MFSFELHELPDASGMGSPTLYLLSWSQWNFDVTEAVVSCRHPGIKWPNTPYLGNEATNQ